MFTRGRVDREADRHMQIGFLSDKRWPPAPAGHVTPARSPAEHESVECMISAILPPLSYHLSVYLDVCLYFFVCSFATNTVCARPKSPPPPSSSTFIPSISSSFLSITAIFTSLFSVIFLGVKPKCCSLRLAPRLVYHCVCWSLSPPIIAQHSPCLIGYIFFYSLW